MTFPTTDATIARTDAAQTFTGVQTFSSDMVVNSLNIGRGKGAVATNTAVGKDAISATATGADNTALGYNTLKAITSGSGNTTVGSQAALAMTTGTNNTVFGNSALSTVTSSQSNTAIGNDALKILGDSTNDRNTAVGTGSFANLTSGQYNVGVGMGSLLNAGSGSNNVAVGKYAGFRDTNNAGVSSSNQSIFIGSETKPLNATSTNEIVIGYDARGLGNNSTVLGNSLITQAKIFGALDLPDATTSTSTTSGALKVGGGVGIVENLNVGGNAKITGTLTVTSGAGAGKVLTSDANGLGTWTTPTGVTTMAAIGSTPNANGATISGRTLNLEPADSTNGGIVTTGTQTFAGAKTFSPTLTAAADGETLVGLDINPTFTNGSYLALTNYALRVQGIGFGRGGGAIVSNTAIGTGTLINNTIGTSNTGLGYQSLVFNTSGTDNTAFGANAGDKISSGSKNIFVGSLAGSKIASASLANSTGTNSVLIGYDVRPAADSQTNQIVISGYNGTAGTVGLGSNTTLIGASTTTDTRIMGALDLPNNTASSSTTTGALKVAGGAGIVENLNVGGNTKITGTISIAGGTPGAGKVLTSTDSSGIASWVAPAGVTTMAAIGSTPNANGATISGANLNLEPANGSFGGIVTTGTQTFAGAKTFTSVINVSPTAASSGAGASSVIKGQDASTVSGQKGGDVSLTAGNSYTNMTGGNIILTPGSGASTGAVKVVGSDLFVFNDNFRVGRGNKGLSGNTAVGSQTLNGVNSGTGGNTAIGSTVLYTNTSGYANTGLGSSALYYNTIGYSNTALGSNALNANTEGNANIAIGVESLSANTTGDNNVAIGNLAMSSNLSTNSSNVAIGYSAMRFVKGDENTAIGNLAGANLGSGGVTGGNNNIFIGSSAGNSYGSASGTNTTGFNSVMIGYDVRPKANGEDNEIVIAGYNGTAGTVGKGSNTTSIGNSATTDTYIYGNLIVSGQVKLNSTSAVLVLSKTTSYDIATTDNANLIVFKGSTASQTIKLPVASANIGREITIKNIASVSVSISSAGGYLISDSSTTTTASIAIGIEPSNNWIKAVSDGTDWIIFRALF
jgi:hypothetical protein